MMSYSDIKNIYHELQKSRRQNISFADAEFAFQKLSTDGFEPKNGDDYFELYGVGNTTIKNRPYERFLCYEFLLGQLKKINSTKFNAIHKGTPYYFLMWTSFDMENYESGVFYLDCAISEDKRAVGKDWITKPAGLMITFNPLGNQSASSYAIELNDIFEDKVLELNNVLKLFPDEEYQFFKNKFVEKFIVSYVNQDRSSLISGFYSFWMQFFNIRKKLLMRSNSDITIEPILSHLFKGCLIFETLLKSIAEDKKWCKDKTDSKPIRTLGNFNDCSSFVKKYGILTNGNYELDEIIANTKLRDISNILNSVYRLRNNLGHSLLRKDVFMYLFSSLQTNLKNLHFTVSIC